MTSEVNAHEKRRKLRQRLQGKDMLRFPGAYSPLIARLIELHEFDGVYISGSVTAASLLLPDLGMTTMTEVADNAREISFATKLPTIVDIDTGFGPPTTLARAVSLLEAAGICGMQIEDQVLPKRSGHLSGHVLCSIPEMQLRVRSAVRARRDPDLLVVARTDAAPYEGIDRAIERAKAYQDCGADVIFPDALSGAGDCEKIARALEVPILVNMAEFGKNPLLTVSELESAGARIVIYPGSTLRLALHAVDQGLAQLRDDGTQKNLLDRMMPRARFKNIVSDADYLEFDNAVGK